MPVTDPTIETDIESCGTMQILAISGSLRAVSSNTALVQAATKLAPDSVTITVYSGLASLPYFNPDQDGEAVPQSVIDLRHHVATSGGILICSPEYAHGVPGVLKNALDWLVSSGETVGKPVALINASPRASHAQESLAEILTTMAANVIAEASVTVPLAGRNLSEADIVSDPELSVLLRSALVALALAVEGSQTKAGGAEHGGLIRAVPEG